MVRSTIDRLIVNPPCEEPAHHWRYDRKTRRFDLAPGRPVPRDTSNSPLRQPRRLAFYGADSWPAAGSRSSTVTPRASAMPRNVCTDPVAAPFSIADN